MHANVTSYTTLHTIHSMSILFNVFFFSIILSVCVRLTFTHNFFGGCCCCCCCYCCIFVYLVMGRRTRTRIISIISIYLDQINTQIFQYFLYSVLTLPSRFIYNFSNAGRLVRTFICLYLIPYLRLIEDSKITKKDATSRFSSLFFSSLLFGAPLLFFNNNNNSFLQLFLIEQICITFFSILVICLFRFIKKKRKLLQQLNNFRILII